MKKGYLIVLGLFLFSCGHKRNESIVKSEKLVRNDSIVKSDTLRDPYSEYFLADLSPKQFAELILKDSIYPSDNFSTFRVMDSLEAKSYEDRKYYFRVFLKIIGKADGALAEAVGDPAMMYVENHTIEFLDFASAINKKDFESWANYVGVEIYLSSRENPLNDEDSYYKILRDNCKNCSNKQLQILEDFHKIVKQSIVDNN
jgi:hypothetical protein